MREPLQLMIKGVRLTGTCHRVPDPVSTPACPGASAGDVGVILLNPGYLPRSARGDLAVHLSDHLARLGFPAFRFDMPGLGDSGSDLPREVLEFFQLVQNAGYEPFFTALRAKLIRRFHLRGLILLGHCGGASTAVYSADKDPSQGLLGLILLDPAFIWYRPPPKPAKDLKGLKKTLIQTRQRLRELQRTLRSRILATSVGEQLSLLYAHLKRMKRQVGRQPLPADANTRLVKCWQRIVARGMPLLVLTAEPPKKRPDYFDYLAYVQQGAASRLTRVNIEGTSHSFVEGGGKEAVFRQVESWLAAQFPNSLAARVAGAKPESAQVSTTT